MNALFSGTDLSQFRPLSEGQKARVRDAINETKRLIKKETAYLPENQNASYILYLTNHVRMLENELALAVK